MSNHLHASQPDAFDIERGGNKEGSHDVVKPLPSEEDYFSQSATTGRFVSTGEASDPSLYNNLRIDTGVARLKPQRSLSEYPQYPNQSLSALQFQRYPGRPQLHHSSRPGSSYAASHATNALLSIAHRDPGSSIWGSRTTSNTPLQTPSLFSSNLPNRHMWSALDGSSDLSPYPSPYLHPVQQQPPKETRVADRGVDTFSGRKIINQYEIIEELGRGVHGKVKLARNLETNEYVAIKVVQRFPKRRRLGKAKTQEDTVKKEVAILKKVHHPNVVQLLEVIDDPEISKIYVVLEFCELREIDWRVQGASEIVVTENRRLEREAQGLPDNSVGTNNDMFLKAAARRRERYQRQRPRTNRMLTGSSDFWSLELGEASDEDDDEFPEIDAPSRDSSVASRRSIRRRYESHEESAPHDLHSPLVPIQSHTSHKNFDARHFENDTASNAEPRSLFSSAYVESSTPPMSLSSKDSRRGRQGSLAESVVSQITEIMEEEIPEDYRYVPTMTIAESRSAFRDAVLGLEYLHYQGIIHRDIKPANLLRTRDHHFKISDFGVSHLGKPMREGQDSEDASESESVDIEEDTELAKTVGTPSFYAPELCAIGFASEMPAVTGQIDVWALGVTLYCLLFARTPSIAENEFVLMRKIAMEDVFIPRKRLKAVDRRPGSRSSSRSPMFPPSSDRRLPSEWAHEEIDDLLYDLLKRIFVKNPKERITLKEVKFHPWVLQDISNHSAWLDETDPARHTQGKKIEISTQEVAEAVIPLKPMDRVKSAGKKVFDVLTSTMGRRRTQSSTIPSDSSSASSLPETTTTGNRGNRQNIRLDDHISFAFKPLKDREHEHPLAQSVSVSSGSDDNFSAEDDDELHSPSAFRPSMPGRDDPSRGTSASTNTIRQSDIDRGRLKYSKSPAGSFPESETLQTTSTAAQLDALFTGSLSRDTSATSGSRHSQNSSSPERRRGSHAPSSEPSLGLNTTPISGQLLSAQPSPVLQKAMPAESKHQEQTANTEYFANFTFDPATTPKTNAMIDDPKQLSTLKTLNLGSTSSSTRSPYDQPTSPATEEQYRQAMESLNRRRVLNDEQEKERSAHSSRPGSSWESGDCPPSPDDNVFIRGNPYVDMQSPRMHQAFNLDTSPRVSMLASRFPNVSSVSSDDQITPGISRSTSFPSTHSAISANSSVALESLDEEGKKDASGSSSGSTVHEQASKYDFRRRGRAYVSGQSNESPAVEADYEVGTGTGTDTSGSEEEFLVMGRGKRSQVPTRSASRAATNTPKSKERQKPKRTDSTNTMKKIDSNDS